MSIGLQYVLTEPNNYCSHSKKIIFVMSLTFCVTGVTQDTFKASLLIYRNRTIILVLLWEIVHQVARFAL